MKFDVLRDLTNKVFTSTIVRKFVQDDADDIVEAGLENDFGPVKVETGSLFSGFITKAADGTYSTSLTGTVSADTIEFKFAIPSNEIALSKTSKIVYSCDGKLEAPIDFDATTQIPALKVSELKCQLFEKAIKDRIEKAVEAWKAEATVFEKTTPAETFTVDLV